MTTEARMNERPAYTVEIRENGHRLSLERIVDPFVTTTIKPRGWRAALDTLRGCMKFEVIVGGDRDRIEAVMELDPDYLAPPGSKSREAWNAQLQDALQRLGTVTNDDDHGGPHE